MSKINLTLNNLRGLMCHKTKPNQTITVLFLIVTISGLMIFLSMALTCYFTCKISENVTSTSTTCTISSSGVILFLFEYSHKNLLVPPIPFHSFFRSSLLTFFWDRDIVLFPFLLIGNWQVLCLNWLLLKHLGFFQSNGSGGKLLLVRPSVWIVHIQSTLIC